MKPILIYKGDDTIFADLSRFLTFNIETNLDLTGWKAKFTLGWITKEISDISSKSFEIILSSDETKNLRLGSQSGSIVLTDSIGHIKTITNSIPFEVTTQVVENEYQEIDLTIPESSGVDIKLKVGSGIVTSINGKEGDVILTAEDVGALPDTTVIPDTSNLATKEELQYGLDTKQDKLIAGSGIDITNNIISNTQTSAEWGNIQGTLSNQTDLQTVLDNKQDVITDLDTIREGASKGATALQSIPSEYVTETELNNKGYLTSYTETDPVYTADKPNLATKTELQQGLNTKQDKGNYALKSEIPTVPTKTSELTNDSGFITSSYHDSTKQDKLTAGDNITIVNNVISATGGGSGGGVDVVQTTGNSTTAVMSQKATTDMPAFKEVITPTKMLKAQNTQYCTSYDTFDYEDIKVAQVYCRQAYNGSINHYRTGNIKYQSAISLYKDDNNYLSIYFNGYSLAVRNRKGNVTINEVDLGRINSGATSINRPENTAWCAEINLQEKTCIFYVIRDGQLSPFGEVVDISTWDLSHLDTFNIVFGCSEYKGDSFCYYCLLNEKIEIDKIINTPIEYGKYNCYDTYLKNDIKPLQVTGIYANNTQSSAVVGTLIEEYDNFHKVFSFSVPVSTGTPPYLGLYGQVQGTPHKGQNCVIKCKFLEFAEGAGLMYALGNIYIYKGTEFVYLSTYQAPLFVPELNVEYTFVINQASGNPNHQYLLRGVGNFTMETLDMYYMVPQSANICAETWDGNFFRGVLPFVGTNIIFSNDYSKITTSRTGLGVPQYFQTTDSNGNIYMYNGTTWKQISN